MSAASLTAFTSSPFAQPGWIARPRTLHPHLRAGERLGLHLAGRRAVDGVRGDGAELLDGEVDDAAADLLVGVEDDLDRAVRDVGVRGEVADRGEDLGDAGLVVGAEQARPVGDDELVAGVVRELRRLRRADRPGPSCRARSRRRRTRCAAGSPCRSPRAPCRRGRRARSSGLRGRPSRRASP